MEDALDMNKYVPFQPEWEHSIYHNVGKMNPSDF